ncbi:AraC family transcriptional regulator [Streptomyces sp. NPDC048404]|uniref:AraC family transcriptional regulator n=1 Tax=unclassified Streptomyces TaxID=2593676 RepID=UPI0034229109
MEPFVRSAALSGYADLCRAMGISSESLLARAGLEPDSLADQDRWIPASAVAKLLEISAEASGRSAFALEMSGLRRPSTLGPISLVIREEPDLRSAIEVLLRHQSLYNEALNCALSEEGGLATIIVNLRLAETVRARQAVELTVGVYHRILRDSLGSGWGPLTVCFTHPAPRDQEDHRSMFGCLVEFDRAFNGIVLYTDDLDTLNPDADPQLLAYARQYLDMVTDQPAQTSMEERVRALIEALLPAGRCSIEHVARSLHVDRRTLHRQLAASGESFASLLDTTRVQLAKRLVAHRDRSLAEVAGLLGFSSPSTFSRWFREHFGCSARDWRIRAMRQADEPLEPAAVAPRNHIPDS